MMMKPNFWLVRWVPCVSYDYIIFFWIPDVKTIFAVYGLEKREDTWVTSN